MARGLSTLREKQLARKKRAGSTRLPLRLGWNPTSSSEGNSSGNSGVTRLVGFGDDSGHAARDRFHTSRPYPTPSTQQKHRRSLPQTLLHRAGNRPSTHGDRFSRTFPVRWMACGSLCGGAWKAMRANRNIIALGVAIHEDSLMYTAVSVQLCVRRCEEWSAHPRAVPYWLNGALCEDYKQVVVYYVPLA